MRQRVLASAVVLTVVVGSVSLATPASAASYSTTVTCVGSSLALSSNNIATAPGDTLVVTNGTGVGLVRTTIANATGPFVVNPSSSGTFTVVGAAGGLLTFTQDPSGPCANATITLNFIGGGGGGGGGGGASTGSAPAPIVQQFGKPLTGTCANAAAAALNWAGVASGGWSESWAQWMNDGKGGSVCSRTLSYSTQLGTWVAG